MTRYKLPRRPLHHLGHSYDAEYARIRKQVAALGIPLSPVRRPSSLRLDLERPFRIINQRKRLFAAYWAGWRPDWMRPTRGLILTSRAERYGLTGPKWLGGRP